MKLEDKMKEDKRCTQEIYSRVAASFLAKTPSGILGLQRQPKILMAIACKMAELDSSKSSMQHLSDIYEYILTFPDKVTLLKWAITKKKYQQDLTFDQKAELVSSESCQTCISERFFNELDEQLEFKESIISEFKLIEAYSHITLMQCEDCRRRAQEYPQVSIWAINLQKTRPIEEIDLTQFSGDPPSV